MTITQSDNDEVREIQAGTAPTRFARGWHCIGLTESFKDGQPHSIEAFGTKLVVFADSEGNVKILDAYCRHMGGDLSQGTIKGDAIACPFHDWRWGGNGKCQKIPYARRVPPLAKTRAWQTLDQDGMLFVWHDPEGNPPTDDVAIPRIEGALSDEWSDWVWYTTTVDTNCREIVDNIVDMAHFFYVHYSSRRTSRTSSKATPQRSTCAASLARTCVPTQQAPRRWSAATRLPRTSAPPSWSTT